MPEVFLNNLSALKVRFFYEELCDTVGCVVVRVEGQHRHGSDGNSDSDFICAMARAAMTAWSPWAVVLDFSDFDYCYGNRLLRLVKLTIDDEGQPTFPLIIVANSATKESMVALFKEFLADESTSHLPIYFVSTITEAYSTVESQWNRGMQPN